MIRRVGALVLAVLVALSLSQSASSRLSSVELSGWERAVDLTKRITASALIDKSTKEVVAAAFARLEEEYSRVDSAYQSAATRAAALRAELGILEDDLNRRAEIHARKPTKFKLPEQQGSADVYRREAELLENERLRLARRRNDEQASAERAREAAELALAAWLSDRRITSFRETAESLLRGSFRSRPGYSWVDLEISAARAAIFSYPGDTAVETMAASFDSREGRAVALNVLYRAMLSRGTPAEDVEKFRSTLYRFLRDDAVRDSEMLWTYSMRYQDALADRQAPGSRPAMLESLESSATRIPFPLRSRQEADHVLTAIAEGTGESYAVIVERANRAIRVNPLRRAATRDNPRLAFLHEGGLTPAEAVEISLEAGEASVISAADVELLRETLERFRRPLIVSIWTGRGHVVGALAGIFEHEGRLYAAVLDPNARNKESIYFWSWDQLADSLSSNALLLQPKPWESSLSEEWEIPRKAASTIR